MKSGAGIYGLSFVIQSAEYSPVYLEAKILEFLDAFYSEEMNKDAFDQWKKGTLDRQKAGYNGMHDEADDL